MGHYIATSNLAHGLDHLLGTLGSCLGVPVGITALQQNVAGAETLCEEAAWKGMMGFDC
jgi:hypothetical protein